MTSAEPISELKPHERICYTDKIDAGVPAAIPLEACYLGWQESLALLEKLVKAEIPDEQ